MEAILGLFLALILSILMMPFLTRYARHLGMVDVPDGRKTHIGLVPRVGGIAIAVSAAIPPTIWIVEKANLAGFVAGGAIIVLFGALDDRLNLDYRIKLLGQATAAGTLIAFDICLSHVPLLGSEGLPYSLSILVTVIFTLAVTNAFNLLDGLDGLAAGCAILSLAGIALLAILAPNGGDVVIIALAVIGGVLGFLRYNTHPARVFMGDAGSQFLGFSIATLCIFLIERTQNAVSPAVILPLLGLPVLDTCMVMLIRVREGRSPFSPDRNHIHHKLLSLGLAHYQAVAVIYAAQAAMVAAAFVLRFESDSLILFAYVSLCFTSVIAYVIFGPVLRARLSQVSERDEGGQTQSLVSPVRLHTRMRAVATRYVEWSVAGYLIFGVTTIRPTPVDISLLALLLLACLVAVMIVRRGALTQIIRLAAYSVVIYVSYFNVTVPTAVWLNSIECLAWIGTVFAALAMVVVLAPTAKFRLTTLDLLIVLVVVAALWIPIPALDHALIVDVLIRCIVFLYACEVLLDVRETPLGPIGLATAISLGLLAARAI